MNKILKKRYIYPCLVIVTVFLISQFLLAEDSRSDDPFIEKGEIWVKNQSFNYEKSYDFLNIRDKKNKIIFTARGNSRDIFILNFGYSKEYNSFFVIKEKIDSFYSNYELVLEYETLPKPFILHSKTPFYSPVLVENKSHYIIYINEDFSLVIFCLETNRLFKKIKFEVPIMMLQTDQIDDREAIKFLKFENGRYIEFFLFEEDIFKREELNYSNKQKIIRKRHKNSKKKYVIKRENLSSDISLDYRKYIGFGDSITRGIINTFPAEDLGYIPRLQRLIDSEFYGGEVINEGIYGLFTFDAVYIFEQVILDQRGKYLLFHLGTNDVFKLIVPVSNVIFNINYMMNIAFQYKVQPILSTLIPRNTRLHDGIYRERAIEISEGIQNQSLSLNIPCIDFWNIFSNYPEDDGGYWSLMSDHAHPSEKGYQLMAEEWLNALKKLPPDTPTDVVNSSISRNRSTIRWSANVEPDFSHYLIHIGYSPKSLIRKVTTSNNYYTFTYFLLHSPFYTKIYFNIQAVDNYGNESLPTSIHQIDFKQ